MSSEPIDRTVLAELQAATGAEFAAELVGTFLEEAPGLIAELRSAHAGGDSGRFQRAAHSLKSNANTFGATALASRARDAELGGLTGCPDQGAAELTELEALLAEATAALKALTNV